MVKPKDDTGDGRLILEDAADEEARAYVRERLKEFNDTHARQRAEERHLEPDIRPLDLLLRDPAGCIHGGLLGYTHWGWLHVQTLWLAEEDRGRGEGRHLLEAAEMIARRRGCHHSRLSTYSFQARGFYERLGYTVYGQLADYPPGYTSYAMAKDLRDGEQDRGA